jgi:hypothetical protein
MKDVARMIKAHLVRILSHFIHHIINVRTEGNNSGIALIEKMAYGYRNKEHLTTPHILQVLLSTALSMNPHEIAMTLTILQIIKFRIMLVNM